MELVVRDRMFGLFHRASFGSLGLPALADCAQAYLVPAFFDLFEDLSAGSLDHFVLVDQRLDFVGLFDALQIFVDEFFVDLLLTEFTLRA